MGEAGVAVPVGAPAVAVQVPPDPTDAPTSALSSRGLQAPGMVSCLLGPPQTSPVYIVASGGVHVAPEGGPHVHALHARVSVDDAYATFLVGYSAGHAKSPVRATQRTSGCCGSTGLGTHTLPVVQAPPAAPAAEQRRCALDHPTGGTLVAGFGMQRPPEAVPAVSVAFRLGGHPVTSKTVHVGASAIGWFGVAHGVVQGPSL